METAKEILWNKHWNVDGVTHGDVCDNHTKISLEFAIEVLKELYDDVMKEGMTYTISNKGKEAPARKIEKKIEELTKQLNP